MNIFRSLARGILNGLRGGRPAEETREVPPVEDLSKYQDGFDSEPVSVASPVKAARSDPYASSFTPATSQGDEFEHAVRAAPVDLSGGVKVHYTLVEESSAATSPPQAFFAASLDDLDLSLLPQQQATEPELPSLPLPLPLGEGRGEGVGASAEFEASTAVVAEPKAEAEVAAPLEVEAPAPSADAGFVASFDDLALLPADPETASQSSGFLASLEDLGPLGPDPDPLPEGEGMSPSSSAHDVQLEPLLLLPKPD